MKNRYAVFEAPKTNSLFVRIFILLACLTLSFAAQANAQAAGDYRSNATVFNWNAAGNWQRWNGSTWVLNPIEGYPGQNPGTGTVTIRDGATVTINVTPANPIGGLVVGEGTSGTLQFDNANRTLNVGSGGVTVNANGTFRVATPANPNNNTHTINISGGGSFINNGTVNFREVSGGNTDVANINLSGNLSGSGTSTFNNITFNGTNNQLIDIGGTVAINGTAAGTITFNNTGTAPNNQITNQSVAFTNAI
ncbi:MAG: G8 domain-containing protein, partial [Candidatus Thermochlorobacter sp.]